MREKGIHKGDLLLVAAVALAGRASLLGRNPLFRLCL
jgi:hypothetical protein